MKNSRPKKKSVKSKSNRIKKKRTVPRKNTSAARRGGEAQKSRIRTVVDENLRKKAEQRLKAEKDRLRKIASTDSKKLVHELGTHQIELEMQNEELRRSQAELESSRARYADLYDFSPVGYFTFDRNGLIKEVNLTGAGMLGMPKRLLIDKSVLFLLDPAHRTIFLDHLREVFRTQVSSTCEITFIPKGGVAFPALLHSFSFVDEDSTVCRTAVNDITELKQAEAALRGINETLEQRVAERTEALRESELKLSALINAADESILLFGLDGSILATNTTAAQRIGMSVDDVLKKKWPDLMPAHLIETRRKKLEEVVNTGKSAHFEDEREETAFEHSVYPVQDKTGAVTAVAIFSSDITERKQAEEALRQSEEQFRTLADSIPNLAWWANAEGYITWYNRRWYEYTGTTPEQMEGWSWQSVHDPRILPKVLKRWKASIATGEPFDMEFPLRGIDGAYRTFLTRVMPLKDSDDRVVRWFGTNTDVSPLKQAEDALRAAHTELAHRTYELEAVNRELESFSYTVSHDLKTPLRHIEGFTRILQEDCADRLDATGRENLHRVCSATERMKQLIEAMLNMARLTSSELYEKTVDIGSLAHVIAHELRKQDPDRQVEFVIADTVNVNGDKNMLQVMLENLIHNAWKFTSKHASARIEFGKTEMEGKTVYFVRDDGAGFDMHFADKLFKPFQRLHTESEFPGLGIGLAIAHRIVLRHNGRLWAESAPEKGATFFFTLG